ncbi:MAG: hypothetical protein KBD60_08960 [Sterolibacterium sp.]|jgi:hypothetical protein|nr:hypothetical protein [Sterolibacterium sp.]
MKIDAYQLDFASQHHASSTHTLQESLRAWTGNQRPDFEGNNREQPRSPVATVAMAAPAPAISNAAYAAQAAEAGRNDAEMQAQAIQDSVDAVENDPRLLLIRQMVKMLTGEDIKIFSAADLQATATPSVNINTASSASTQATQAPARAGFGIEYDRHEVRTETEQTAFQAQGVIRTTDGKEISFQLDLQMSRHYREESNVSLRAGDGIRKDPLVINFNGASAQLQSQRFSFDLEGDGGKEQVALLGGNSGYLALDLNHNGKVDSGKELFGVQSGNGFADLARHDDDGNGWIDENDAIYQQLRVWTPTADGAGKLATLKEKQVGALYLGSQSTPFELRDAANQSLGAVRASGVWLAENGQTGSLQQIDLTV